jgi:mono/diheme cytochrome c family protein
MYAYLRTVTAVSQRSREHELHFPYRYRSLLALWRALYFRPGEYRADAAQSASWNRGAYLVQGLAHCSACHTARNTLGGLPTAP